MEYIGIAICIIFFGYYIWEIKKTKFDTKTIVIIGVCAGVSVLLSMIKFMSLPQGGGISLFPFLFIMILSFIYGKAAGMTGGLVYSLVKLVTTSIFAVSTSQFLMEYIVCNMAVGCASMFGNDKRYKILLGSLVVVAIDFLIHFFAGAIFFGEYAGEMNKWLYSFIYNGSTSGIEGILTCIVMMTFPLNKVLKITGNIKSVKA
jgi:thiamine transporter